MMGNRFPILWPQRWRLSPWWPREPRWLVRMSLLRILAVAHDQRLEPIALITNLAEEHRGSNRRLLRRLARRIASGTPVVDALEQTPEVLSAQQVLAIRFGHQLGTLGPTYHSLILQGQGYSSSAEQDLWQAKLYGSAMTIVLVLVLSFLYINIFPRLQRMSEELGVGSLPWPYSLVVAIGHTPWEFVLVPVVIALVVVLLWSGPLGRSLRRSLTTSRFHAVHQLRIAELLDLLAQSVDAGRPLSGALSTLARYHFDTLIRLRLLFIRNEVEQGASIWDSLRDAELLSPVEANSLAHSSSPAARAWLMRRLASRKRERTLATAEAAARGVQFVVIFIIAGIVLLFTYSTFQWLAHLVHSNT